MNALIAVLTFLAAQGVTLADFDIDTHYNDNSYWSCDAYAQPDATIVVCPDTRKIHIIKGDRSHP